MKEKDDNKSIWSKRALAVLVAFGIVSFWRGCWGLMDTFLIPQDEILSYIASIIIGVLILLFTHKIITHLG